MKDKLEKYVNGEINYSSLLTFFSKALNKNINIFEILGKYSWTEVLNKKLPSDLKYLEDKLLSDDKVIKKIDIFNSKDRAYASLSTMLLTHSDFVIDKLKELFGEPIYHDEFGEGFEGEYDDDTDDYGEPDIKESFASYFVTIEGVDFHIGYDHRGLTIEIKDGTNIEDLITALKKFIYLCYTNNKYFK